MDPRANVNPGDPLRLAASQINGLNRLLATYLGTAGAAGSAQTTPYTWVMARNGTGSTAQRWSVLSITGLDVSPTASLAQFEIMPIVTCGAPSATTTAWGVAVEPIEIGKLGKFAVAGVVQIKVADLGKAAGAAVLWKDSMWALIRFGSGIVRGRFTGNWSIGSTATVTDVVTTSKTYTVRNYIASLATSGTVTCSIAQVGGEWILVAWDWTALSGYSGSAQQVLAHNASGQLIWLNTTACT